MNKINRNLADIHADDYAISTHASKDILECIKKGKLNSISIVPNMSCFQECMRMLMEQWDTYEAKPLISVHLNVMEGHCCSNPEDVPDLVDQKGFFKVSWGGLIKASYSKREFIKIKKQLKQEIKQQIDVVQAAIPSECSLRLDSHQHTHMIPIVWKALMEVIDEVHYDVEFIRVAKEPLSPFMKQISLFPSYSIINIVKNVILNWYAIRANKDLRLRNIESMLLWGLIMSGHMDADRIIRLYEPMLKYCKRKGKNLEILFHPGTALKEELGEEYVKEGFVQFHLSKGREIERWAVENL